MKLTIDRPLKFNRVKLPNRLKVSWVEARRITQFREMPYISPSLTSHICGLGRPRRRSMPDMFYVSLKGDRDSVFLREAYRNSQLIDKSHLVLLKEKMRALVAVPRFPRRGGPRTGEETEGANEGSDTEDEDDDFSDMDDLIGELGGKSDNDYHWGDGWVGESDATPPDFGDGDDSSSSEEAEVTMKEPVDSINGDSSDPVFPDGRQRERW